MNKKRYAAHIGINNKTIPLGTYDTPEKAFEIYCIHKEKYIKTLAEKYKEVLNKKTYNTLINWKVKGEI